MSHKTNNQEVEADGMDLGILIISWTYSNDCSKLDVENTNSLSIRFIVSLKCKKDSQKPMDLNIVELLQRKVAA